MGLLPGIGGTNDAAPDGGRKSGVPGVLPRSLARANGLLSLSESYNPRVLFSSSSSSSSSFPWLERKKKIKKSKKK
jgi:hypothetical protein